MNYKDKANNSFDARLRFYYFYCVIENVKIDEEVFFKFDIDEEASLKYVNLYTSEYQQFDRKHIIKGQELNNDKIYAALFKYNKENKAITNTWRKRYREEVFAVKFSEDSFNAKAKIDNCFYCGITMSQINELAEKGELVKKNERGFSLELDRKYPNKEYSDDNCVMSCYWCNNAKTDEFTAEEFAPIGEAIAKIWEKRLVDKSVKKSLFENLNSL